MALSFARPDYTLWASATSSELYSLDLQELFNHLFLANQRTTVAFLQWLPTSYYVGQDLAEFADHKLFMLQAPITYSNEDSDRRQDVSAWAMGNIPVARWIEWRNHVAYQRHIVETQEASE